MQNKLIVCYIGQDVQDFLPLSLDSVKDYADAIVFVDGGSKDDTTSILKINYDFGEYQEGYELDIPRFNWTKKQKRILINREYEHKIKGSNGRARNCYLDFVKKHFKGWLCLVLDPDEVVDDRLKDFLKSKETKSLKENHLLSIHMRHTIRDLATEDTTVNTHYVHNRMFMVTDDLFYPEAEHPILTSKSPDAKYGYTNMFTIWHIGYSREMFTIKKKYDNHMNKSTSHTPQFLRQWLNWHRFGTYPTKRFDPRELPSVVKKYFDIIDDEIYFQDRKLEVKHFIDAWHWKGIFGLNGDGISGDVIEFGCGLGPRVLAMNIVGISAEGIDLSQWAVDHRMHDSIRQGDIRTYRDNLKRKIVVAYDILEHLDYSDLDKAIETIKVHTHKHVLISVPVVGDPNLERDPTHKIKETKEWWIKKVEEHGFKIKETPQWFNFANQIIIAEK